MLKAAFRCVQMPDISWNAKKDACLEGLNVNVHGKVSAIVKGNATAELLASGQTNCERCHGYD